MRKKTILSAIFLVISFLLVMPSYAGCLGGRCGPIKRIAVRRAQRGKPAIFPRFRAKALRDCGVSGGGRRTFGRRGVVQQRDYAGRAVPTPVQGPDLVPAKPEVPSVPTPAVKGKAKPEVITTPKLDAAAKPKTGPFKRLRDNAAEKPPVASKPDPMDSLPPLTTSASVPNLKSALEQVVNSQVGDTLDFDEMEIVRKKNSIIGNEYFGIETPAGATTNLGPTDQVTIEKLLKAKNHTGDTFTIGGVELLLGAQPNAGDTRGRSIHIHPADKNEQLLGYTGSATFSSLLEKVKELANRSAAGARGGLSGAGGLGDLGQHILTSGETINKRLDDLVEGYSIDKDELLSKLQQLTEKKPEVNIRSLFYTNDEVGVGYKVNDGAYSSKPLAELLESSTSP